MSPDHYDVVYISKVRRYPVNGRYRRQGVFNGYDAFKHEALQRYLYHVGYYWLIGDIHNNQFSSTYLRVRDVTRDPDNIRNAWEEKGRNRRWQRNDYLEVDCSGFSTWYENRPIYQKIGTTPEQLMREAVYDIMLEGQSTRYVAQLLGIKRTSLLRYVDKPKPGVIERLSPNYEVRRILS
ncbi:hypothetical protein LSH36_282g01054 [Paralvinella palmiformis]|uniref:Uncharacterized protein n=1 Tax=Paralvinella palmiformis TaxID=53620 RepID=A0AAD9JIY2_9ANNE|nr:hypothetical protein LSH36_282g01054 [Paralvinella palmiformis]